MIPHPVTGQPDFAAGMLSAIPGNGPKPRDHRPRNHSRRHYRTVTADALRRLGTRFSLLVLSNVDRRSFARSNRHLGVAFDRIVTAEDVGSYKPSPANFTALLAAVDDLGLTPDQLLHVAESLYHDHVPAHHAGLWSVWIHRRHAVAGFGATPPPDVDVTPEWRFESMAAFAAAAGT